jgi:hypothetical protein
MVTKPRPIVTEDGAMMRRSHYLFATGSNAACAISTGYITVIVNQHFGIAHIEVVALAEGELGARVHSPHLSASVPSGFYFSSAATTVTVDFVSVIALPLLFSCNGKSQEEK